MGGNLKLSLASGKGIVEVEVVEVEVVEVEVVEVEIVEVEIVEVEIVEFGEVIAGRAREAKVRSSGAACATALQYAAGEARAALRKPKPPSLMGSVRDKRASGESGVGRRSLVTAVEMTFSSKYSAVGRRMSGRRVRVR